MSMVREEEDDVSRVCLSTRDLENDIEISTAQRDVHVRAYTSVEHALNWYFRLRNPPALDVERAAQPSGLAPSPDIFICDQHEAAVLAVAFQAAEKRAPDSKWPIWAGVRVRGRPRRDFSVSKTEVGRVVRFVDGLVESELRRRGRWATGYIRDDGELSEYESRLEELKREDNDPQEVPVW